MSTTFSAPHRAEHREYRLALTLISCAVPFTIIERAGLSVQRHRGEPAVLRATADRRGSSAQRSPTERRVSLHQQHHQWTHKYVLRVLASLKPECQPTGQPPHGRTPRTNTAPLRRPPHDVLSSSETHAPATNCTSASTKCTIYHITDAQRQNLDVTSKRRGRGAPEQRGASA